MMAMNWNRVSTIETYRLLFSHCLPFIILLQTLVTIFNLIIWPSIMPEVEKDREINAFKGLEVKDMKTNKLRCH